MLHVGEVVRMQTYSGPPSHALVPQWSDGHAKSPGDVRVCTMNVLLEILETYSLGIEGWDTPGKIVLVSSAEERMHWQVVHQVPI